MHDALLWVLLAVNVTVAAVVVAWRTKRRGGVAFEHVELFSFGFLYYWMLPAAAALLPPLEDSPAVNFWYSLATAVRRGTMPVYLALTLCFYLSFVGGAAVARRVGRPVDARPAELPFDARLLDLLLPACALVGGLMAFQLRASFFTSYDAIFDTAGPARGPFLAFSVFVLSLALLYTASRGRTCLGEAAPSARVLRNRWVLLYLVVGGAVLALGGRMYLVTGILALATYASAFIRPFAVRSTAGLVVGGATLAGLVGAVRFGFASAQVTPATIAASVAFEPIFTSFSLFDFLRQGRLELLNVPYPLATQFLNFVPTFVLPNKVDYMVTPEDLGYSVRAPLGALSAFVSLMVNFGSVGSCVVLCAFGASLERMRQRRSVYATVAYSMICGFLAFSLFRDPFYTSVVKSVVQLSLLTPAVIVAALHVLTVLVRAPRPVVTSAEIPSIRG